MIHASFLKLSKPCSGPRTRHSFHPVRSKDGSTLIKDQQGILARWAEHLSELLNSINAHNPNLLDQLPQFPFISGLDAPSSLHEVTQAVKGLKNNKASGPHGIPAEIFKYGCQTVLASQVTLFHFFFTWNSKQLFQQ